MGRFHAHVLASLGVLLAGTVLVGCGGETTPEQAPSKAATDCRDKWHELATSWQAQAESTFESDLPRRWESLASSAQLQASSADGSNCDEHRATASAAAKATAALTEQLRPFDLVWQSDQFSARAQQWIAQQQNATGKFAAKKHAQAKKATMLRKRLEQAAPLAVTDMRAGWESAVATDPADEAKVTKLLGEMTFLAGDSAPYLAGKSALQRLHKLIDGPVSRR